MEWVFLAVGTAARCVGHERANVLGRERAGRGHGALRGAAELRELVEREREAAEVVQVEVEHVEAAVEPRVSIATCRCFGKLLARNVWQAFGVQSLRMLQPLCKWLIDRS